VLHFKTLLTAEVDLEQRRLRHAQLDERKLEASEAMIVIAFHAFTVAHCKFHACGNWVANCTYGNREDVPLRRSAIATVIMNYLTKTEMPRYIGYIDGLSRFGITRRSLSAQNYEKLLRHGLEEGLQDVTYAFKNLYEHSEVLKFADQTRDHFRSRMDDYRGKDIPEDIDAEALFVSTVLHSVEHWALDRAIEDALWFDVTSSDFGIMAEYCRVSRACLMNELPLLSWKRFKTTKSPFYQDMYTFAREANHVLAECLDTCIAR